MRLLQGKGTGKGSWERVTGKGKEEREGGKGGRKGREKGKEEGEGGKGMAEVEKMRNGRNARESR